MVDYASQQKYSSTINSLLCSTDDVIYCRLHVQRYTWYLLKEKSERTQTF